MNAPLQLVFGAAEWLEFFLHYMTLSLLAVGGAIATIPDMHRFLVENHHWLTEAQKAAGQKIMPCVSRFEGTSLVLDR